MSLKAKLLLTVLIELYIISQFGSVDSAIGCFVCSSRNGSNPDCEDPFHPGLMNNSYQERCKVPKRNHIGEFPAHFCIKVIGKSYETNEKIVVRRCTILTMENQCGNFQIENDLLRGCVLTCGLDGCNDSHTIHHNFSTILAAIFSVLISIFFCMKCLNEFDFIFYYINSN